MPKIVLNNTELVAEKNELSKFLASQNAYADADFGKLTPFVPHPDNIKNYF